MLMRDIEQIKKTWTVPDGWSITTDDGFVQVLDSENDVIAETITQDQIVENIHEHLKAQEAAAAFHMMATAMKDSTES